MKLVDTSCWINYLRRTGRADVRQRVEAFMSSGEAAWCPAVRLELWNGVGSERDRMILRALEKTLPDLEMGPEVWE